MVETLNNKKIYFLLFIVLVVSTFILTGDKEYNFCKDGNSPVKLTMVGDLIIVDSGAVWQQIVKDNYSLDIVGDYFSIFEESDFVFANFEGIISEQREAREKGLPALFSLQTKPEIVRFLENFGNITLSFANNHSADYGQGGINDTLSLLPKDGVEYIGIGSNKERALAPHIVEKSGVRIAFVALTDLLPEAHYASSANAGVAQLTAENLGKAIEAAKKSANFVVVSLHTAEREGSSFSFWPDAHQVLFSRMAIDDGADLVVGHHPHGLQLSETYRGKSIFYSLGAFLYNPSISKRYPPGHRLFDATQLKGGGVLDLKICKGYISHFDLFPTKVVSRKENLMVVPSFSPAWLSAIFPHLSHSALNAREVLSNSLSKIKTLYVKTF